MKKQGIIDKIKYKLLLKQNILGLLKPNLQFNIIELYSDPGNSNFINDLDLYNIKNIISKKTTVDFNTKINVLMTTSVSKYIDIYDRNIFTSLNIEDILEKLLINYRLLESNYINIHTNQQQNLQIDIDLEIEQQTSQIINTSIRLTKISKIEIMNNFNFSIDKQSPKQKNNMFFFLLTRLWGDHEYYIIYNHKINNILVIDLETLNSLLANNLYKEFHDNNTLILISNYEDYGKKIDIELKLLLIFCFKSLINQLMLSKEIPNNFQKYLYYTKEEYKYFKENEQKIIDFNESFTNYYV